MADLELGIIGLGKMGSNLALQCIDRGIRVVAHSKHRHPDMAAKNVVTVPEYTELAGKLKAPRIIYISAPACNTVDDILDALVPSLDKGDVVMDGGELVLPGLDKKRKGALGGWNIFSRLRHQRRRYGRQERSLFYGRRQEGRLRYRRARFKGSVR